MKKIIIYFSAILILFGVNACDDDATSKELLLDKEELILSNEQEGVINIIDGNGNYTVTPENENIASFKLQQEGGEKWKIVVNALNVGTTKVTVSDSHKKNKSFNLVVKHTDIALEKYSTEVLLGQSVSVVVTKGSGNYMASANNSNVTVSVENAKIMITGKVEGDSEVTIKDIETEKIAKVNVVVKPVPELSVDKENLKFILGDSEANRTITITGGLPPYKVIQWDSSKYSDPKTTVSNITFDDVTPIEHYGTTYDMKTGEVADNILIFNSSEQAYTEKYIIKDSNDSEVEVVVSVVEPLSISETDIEVIVGQTINDLSKIKLKGLVERFEIKTGYNTSIVEASIEQSSNTSARALILKGLAVGTTKVTVTDGVVEKSVNVNVVASEPMTLHKINSSQSIENNEIDSSVNQELGSFIIKGGTKSFTITKEDPNNLLKEIEAPSVYVLNDNWFKFTLERNTQVAQGGEVSIIVKDNGTNETKQFIVNCETLLELSMTINGALLQKGYSESDPYYTISEGMYAGYNFNNIAVGTVIHFTVKNGSGKYKIEQSSYGSDKTEITETENNVTFSVKVVKSGTYYGDIVISDENDETKKVKITRIYN